MTPMRAAMVAETTKMIAELMEKVKGEQKRSAELEKQVADLEEDAAKLNKTNSEAVYEHLQEVKGLRESLDKANVEIEHYRAKEGSYEDCNTLLQEREKDWDEERKKLEDRINGLEDECRTAKDGEHTKCEERLGQKEKEYEDKIKDLNDKFLSAQKDEHRARAMLETKECEWDEERTRLKAELKTLNETEHTGSDSFSVTS